MPFLPEQSVLRNARVVENHRAGVGGTQAELVLLSPRQHTGVVLLDDERRDGAVELRKDDGDPGDAAVRDVALLSRENELVAIAASGGGDGLEVGAGVALGERDGGQAALVGGKHREIAALLLFAAETQQRPHREHRRADRRREARAAPRELLGDQRRRHSVHAAAAELARNCVRREAERCGLRQQ